MSLSWLKFALDVLWGMGTLVALYFGWMNKRQAANKEALNRVEERLLRDIATERTSGADRERNNEESLDDLRARLGRVEEKLKHLPTGRDMADVRDALSALAAQVAELRGAQHGTTRMVERMNEYLMERGK